jgi:hypothetical protein
MTKYNNNNNNKSNQDKYSIVDFPNKKIHFEGRNPKIAANKVFTYLTKFVNIKDDDYEGKFIVFVIKNINTKKEFKYIGTKIKLENIVLKDKNHKKYKNIVGIYNDELNKLQSFSEIRNILSNE